MNRDEERNQDNRSGKEKAMPGAMKRRYLTTIAVAVVTLLTGLAPVEAAPVTINLTATAGYIATPDGSQTYAWGFTDNGSFRYPGPTIDVVQGDVVTVNLTNYLPDPDGSGPLTADPVSLIFFGQEGVSNQTPVYETMGDGTTLRSLASEAMPGGGIATYVFTANRPGTYYYQSGTYPQKQIEMGLFGGLIVRPAACTTPPCRAYGTPDSTYDREYLLLMSAIDPIQHHRVEQGLPYLASAWLPALWFINGRSFPDTIAPANVSYLSPAQPMSALVAMYPGERVLFRMATLDRDAHPFHHHGNHARLIAKNGTLLQSSPTAGMADLSVERFTQTVLPGETQDTIFTWKGNDPAMNLGWDTTGTDSTRPVPVVVNPTTNNPDESLAFGEFYSGSPYLGHKGELPPAHTSMNHVGEHFMVFHSHHEYELQNFDEGPGGLLTEIMICPPMVVGAPLCF